MSEIRNVRITDVSLTMMDHGCLTFYLNISGGGWGGSIGGYALGNGYLGADDFVGSADGLECLMRIMDVVGVARWEDLKGEYIRVEFENLGSSIYKIGNIIEDKWFDIKEFFSQRNNIKAK